LTGGTSLTDMLRPFIPPERTVDTARYLEECDSAESAAAVAQRLLDGICPEAAELLRTRNISMPAIWILKKMRPIRQIEAAELMITMNKFTASYAKSLLTATPTSQLVECARRKSAKGYGEQVILMEREAATLNRQFKAAERSYGSDQLQLVLAQGYLVRLLGSAVVVRYLADRQPEFLSHFQKMANESTAPEEPVETALAPV
jgi:hypothetical protein